MITHISYVMRSTDGARSSEACCWLCLTSNAVISHSSTPLARSRRLDELSRTVGFEYKIYLIVPSHDILRGTYSDTLDMLNSVATKSAIPTAHLFLDSPEEFYFSYDGHLNAKGSRRVAEFLIAQDSLPAENTLAVP